MSQQERIRAAFDRNQRALGLRPSVGQGTAVTRVKLEEGTTCTIEDGPFRLIADMGEKHGGANQGPNSGVLGRGALGSCLAIAYALWAAHMEVPLDSLEVEIHADYDARGNYGVGDVPPAYRHIRYAVTITSPAPEARVREMMDQAEAHCPYLDIFARPMEMTREVHIHSTKG